MNRGQQRTVTASAMSSPSVAIAPPVIHQSAAASEASSRWHIGRRPPAAARPILTTPTHDGWPVRPSNDRPFCRPRPPPRATSLYGQTSSATSLFGLASPRSPRTTVATELGREPTQNLPVMYCTSTQLITCFFHTKHNSVREVLTYLSGCGEACFNIGAEII